MKSSVTIVVMIGVIQMGQTFAAFKKDLSEDLLDLLIKCRNQKTEIDGVFTVPMNGLYLVSSSMMSDRGTHLHCHLWRNGQSNVGVFGTGFSQGTLNAVMDLNKGERLTIRHDSRGSENVYGVHWSMFSAYLISK